MQTETGHEEGQQFSTETEADGNVCPHTTSATIGIDPGHRNRPLLRIGLMT